MRSSLMDGFTSIREARSALTLVRHSSHLRRLAPGVRSALRRTAPRLTVHKSVPAVRIHLAPPSIYGPRPRARVEVETRFGTRLQSYIRADQRTAAERLDVAGPVESHDISPPSPGAA